MLPAVRLLAGALLAAAGCVNSASPPATPEVPGHTPGTPGLGAHALSFHRIGENRPLIATAPMSTAPSGSTIIVGVGRGQIGAHAPPTDSHGNTPYQQLGEAHTYTNWPSSGTALYAFTSMTGGDDHVVRVETPPADEVTLAAVEVLDGSYVHAFEWSEVLAGSPLTSKRVTTTGPATLIAFWWGDAGVAQDKTAVPNNDFVVIDSVLASGALVQAAVAVKNVAEAGTYDVTWTATPRQGAQLWLVAVQK